MIYRQKILLALVEVFGGDLLKTDLQKLLFLFCKYNGIDHYEFFPFRYGAFSLVSYYDKKKLTQRKLLVDTENFVTGTSKSFVNALRREDSVALRKFSDKVGNIRGDSLVRMTYVEYPNYATKSEIATRVLTDRELRIIESVRVDSREEELFTIGYEGISIDGYLNRLIERDVRLVVDVRKNPVSRKYGFSKRRLESFLTSVGILYLHEPEVGVASHMRRSIDSPEDYAKLFEHYAEEILPDKKPVVNRIIEATKKYRRVALTCFEADPKMCHRHKISEAIDALTSDSVRITHL